jgi:hypothetical protein
MDENKPLVYRYIFTCPDIYQVRGPRSIKKSLLFQQVTGVNGFHTLPIAPVFSFFLSFLKFFLSSFLYYIFIPIWRLSYKWNRPRFSTSLRFSVAVGDSFVFCFFSNVTVLAAWCSAALCVYNQSVGKRKKRGQLEFGWHMTWPNVPTAAPTFIGVNQWRLIWAYMNADW